MSLITKIENAFLNSAPVQWVFSQSKKIVLPGFNGIHLYDVGNFFIGQVRTIGMTERASAIAFNFVMAIPPSIIFLFTLIPFLPISEQFQNGLYTIIRDIVPGENNNAALINFLSDFINNPRNGLLSVGFVLSMYFSSNAVMGIMRSFDKNYIGFRKRNEFQKRVVAIKITMVLFIFVFASVLLLIGRQAALKFFGIQSESVINLLISIRWLIIILLFFFSISFIYRHAPAVDKKWKMINPGSLLATILMLVLTFLFSWWVSRFDTYNQLYRSIGTILILMLLIFFNSLILLIGFELNVSITSLRKIADEREDNDTSGEEESN